MEKYNLKTFLDLALQKEQPGSTVAGLDLKTAPYKGKQNADVQVNANVSTPESGCVHVELNYLWSGDLGTAKPVSNEAAFITRYGSLGTKIVNLVVVNPSGTTDYGIDFLDTN